MVDSIPELALTLKTAGIGLYAAWPKARFTSSASCQVVPDAHFKKPFFLTYRQPVDCNVV